MAAGAPRTKIAVAAAQQALALGQQHHRAGRLEAAERQYRMVLESYPDHPVALNLLGVLAVSAGQPKAAVDLMSRAAKANGRDPAIRNNLGNALLLTGEPAKAVVQLKKALALAPKFPEALCNMGRALRKLGRAEQAQTWFRKALAVKPDLVDARAGLGKALRDLGRMDEAVEELRRAIALNPGSAAGYANLTRAKKFTEDDPEREQVEALLSRGDLKRADRSRLHYVAGKICDDLRRYDDAFEHFRQANELSGTAFDRERAAAATDRLIDTLSAEFLAERRDFGDPSERPVFIVGMPRSGTTLAEQIVASHPHICGAGELETMIHVAGAVHGLTGGDRGYPDCIADLTPSAVRDLARRYLTELKRYSRTAARVTDKMPHNFDKLGLISLLFPRARIIHCRRDPIDTCLSCFMHEFHEKHTYNCDLVSLGLYYREYERLMAHWHAALPTALFELRYEDLVADQQAMSRALIEFCGLPWDDRCLAFHKADRSVQTPSAWQVRQPIYTRSVERWRHYERHLGPLIEVLGQTEDNGRPRRTTDPDRQPRA